MPPKPSVAEAAVEEHVEEEAPVAEPIVIPETGLSVRFEAEWVEQWFKNPSEESINTLLGLEPGSTNIRDTTICDFIYGGLMHARSISLKPLPAAIFCSIMQELISEISEMPQKDLFAHFQDRIQTHRKAGYFTINETYLMINFVTTVLFKHIRLYSYCLTNPKQQKRTFVCHMPMEPPMGPPPTLEIAVNVSQRDREAKQEALEEAERLAEERQEKIRQGLIDPDAEAQPDPDDAFDPRNLMFNKVEIDVPEDHRPNKQGGAGAQGAGAQGAGADGGDEAGTFNDPKFKKLLVPLEEQKFLEKSIAETETRINDMFAKVSSPRRPLEEWQD